jgi:hypothetical protein
MKLSLISPSTGYNSGVLLDPMLPIFATDERNQLNKSQTTSTGELSDLVSLILYLATHPL